MTKNTKKPKNRKLGPPPSLAVRKKKDKGQKFRYHKKHMIPFNSESGSYYGKIGGAVCSEKKRHAARLRALKHYGINDERKKMIYDMIVDSESSAMDILVYLDEIRGSTSIEIREKITLAKAFIDWHKMQHGEKHKNENLNINVTTTADQVAERISSWKTKRGVDKIKERVHTDKTDTDQDTSDTNTVESNHDPDTTTNSEPDTNSDNEADNSNSDSDSDRDTPTDKEEQQDTSIDNSEPDTDIDSDT